MTKPETLNDLTPLDPIPKPKRRVRRKAAPKPVATPLVAEVAPIVPKPADRSLTHYAVAGVALMSLLSAGLNGYANAQHSPVAWAGWGMGLAIPAIILLLGKVAGILHVRGFRPLAYTTAGAGLGLLVLSVWHCATSISLITGASLLLAMPMAVAIDVGFVCCELAILVDE